MLDIGSGWGGLALFLAEIADVNVTGVTLSSEQHRVSNQRARVQGLDGQVRFELDDYRALDRRLLCVVGVRKVGSGDLSFPGRISPQP